MLESVETFGMILQIVAIGALVSLIIGIVLELAKTDKPKKKKYNRDEKLEKMSNFFGEAGHCLIRLVFISIPIGVLIVCLEKFEVHSLFDGILVIFTMWAYMWLANIFNIREEKSDEDWVRIFKKLEEK